MLLTGEARCMSLAQEFLTYRVYVHQRVHFKNLESEIQVFNLNFYKIKRLAMFYTAQPALNSVSKVQIDEF